MAHVLDLSQKFFTQSNAGRSWFIYSNSSITVDFDSKLLLGAAVEGEVSSSGFVSIIAIAVAVAVSAMRGPKFQSKLCGSRRERS